MAVTDPRRKHHGISAFIVEKGTPGFKPGKKENKLGLRASDTSEVVFTIAACPAENLLGKEGEGFVNSLQILDGGRISIASLGLGMAQGAYEARCVTPSSASNSAKPSRNFRRFSSSSRTWPRRSKPRACSRTSCMARRPRYRFRRLRRAHHAGIQHGKALRGRSGRARGERSVQIHGGYGFIKDYPAEKFYRDVKLCTIGEGTSEIQRLVIARQILGKK
jgi:alkylation response protein AidB-like acyl-CoA dehydrogenase